MRPTSAASSSPRRPFSARSAAPSSPRTAKHQFHDAAGLPEIKVGGMVRLLNSAAHTLQQEKAALSAQLDALRATLQEVRAAGAAADRHAEELLLLLPATYLLTC